MAAIMTPARYRAIPPKPPVTPSPLPQTFPTANPTPETAPVRTAEPPPIGNVVPPTPTPVAPVVPPVAPAPTVPPRKWYEPPLPPSHTVTNTTVAPRPRPTPTSDAGETPGVTDLPGVTPTVPTTPGTARPTSTVMPRPTATPRPVTPPAPPIVEPPEGSLEGDIYAPGNDPRLTGAQTATDAAGNRVQNGASYSARAGGQADRYRSVLGTGQVNATGVNQDVPFHGVNGQVTAGAVDPNARFRSINTNIAGRGIDPRVAGGPDVAGAESGKYVAEQDQALAGLAGPSRTELAKTALADFDAQGERSRDQRFRKVGQTAAKFGTMGLGSVNAELGSIEGDFQRDRLEKSNELARSVAEGDISDRFRRVDATSGLRGQESGIEAGLRGESRTERDYDTGLDERNLGRDFAERDFQTEIEANNIDRARSERDSELGVDERNIGRQFDERGFQTGLGERNVGRATSERDAALGAGERAVGRRTTERDAMLGVDERNAGRAFDRETAALDYGGRDATAAINNEYDQLNAAGTLEDRVFNQGGSNRNEMRTERGYQGGRRQQTLDNRVRQRELENAEREAEFRRATARTAAGG